MTSTPDAAPEPVVFWGEIAPCEHIVQIYTEDSAFLDALEGFVNGGLRAGDCAIVIATEGHRKALENRLMINGIDLSTARAGDQYIALDAEAILAKFMVSGWPDDARFDSVISDLLERGRRGGRRVRAFGEMVALLWAQGNHAATVRLEHLWNQLCLAKGFSLFCAYPRVGFTQDAGKSIGELCAAHSRVVH